MKTKTYTLEQLKNRKTIDLIVGPKHVRGNRRHSGENCPAARAAMDMIDPSSKVDVRAMVTYLVFNPLSEPFGRGVRFHSTKLVRAIEAYDKSIVSDVPHRAFPVGTYRLRRVA